MYSHLLLAADGSKNALRAAHEALKIASAMPGCKIEILFVIDNSKVKEEVLHSQNQEEREYKRHQKLLPIEEVFADQGIPHHFTTIHGDPGPAIVDYAKKNEIDLIILGSRGLNALQEFVLGSVSHKVVKRASCPVMIVK
ncbi:universal stress protein [Saccharibacillus kuerlensis]|uniref:Universal stress protein n=1 Tax=Saccharibacillus kuerlensis TaxID=459527 RepID=A0ABQ2L8D3_9BACL|nr:universal stress protein [Saccharibacillus kuerlensis]GGO06617.1 universal stress protein [Saccharibacillus kuerlensis]